MFNRRPRPSKFTREQSLAMKPIQLVEAELKLDEQGNGKLAVPVRPTRVARWFIKDAKPRTKSFELDPVGVFVWNEIDGKKSVEQLIRKIASEYNLELRQAEASTTAFLKTLMTKGLIGIPIDKESGKKR